MSSTSLCYYDGANLASLLVWLFNSLSSWCRNVRNVQAIHMH